MSVAVEGKKKNTIFYVHVVIFFLLTFGIGFLPPFAQITPVGMKVLGAFLGVIYGWLFVDMGWPGFVALVALGISGYTDSVQSLFVEGFSFWCLPAMLLCFLFADVLAKSDITNYIASRFMSLKIFVGRPFVLMAGYMVLMEILIFVQAGLAGMFLLWSVCQQLAKNAGLPKHNAFCNIMFPSILIIYVITGFLFPFAGGSIVNISLFQQGTGLDVPFIQWIAWFFVFVNFYIVLWTVFVKFVLRPDFSAIAALSSAGDMVEKEKMTSDQRFGLSMLILFVAMMFLMELLPQTWLLTITLKKIGLIGVLAIVLVIMSIRRDAQGKSFLNLQESAKSISWDAIWLIVAVQPLAAAFGDNEMGIMPSLLNVIQPILFSMNSFLFLAVCTFVLGLVTQISNNFVLMVVFIPLLCSMYQQMGGNPYTLMMCLIIILNCALGTPAASYTAAILFGYDSMEKKQAYFQGFAHFFFCFVLLMLIGVPTANLLF